MYAPEWYVDMGAEIILINYVRHLGNWKSDVCCTRIILALIEHLIFWYLL